MKLRDVMQNNTLLEQAGLNPYCCNEGADPDDYVEIYVQDVITYTDEELDEIRKNLENK